MLTLTHHLDLTPARFVPYALRDKVEKELQRLQEEGIIEPVEFAEWAAPIVAVLKRDRNCVRICGDFSVTINPVSKLDRYPIPKVEDLFARLSKGKQIRSEPGIPTASLRGGL